MNRKIVRWIAILIAVAMIITSFSFVMFLPGLFGAAGVTNEYIAYGTTTASEENYLKGQFVSLDEYVKFIHDNYKDKISYEDLMKGAYAGIIETLGDPYSEYYMSDSDSKDFTETVNGDYGGIGVTISFKNGVCEVVATTKGAPAAEAGMKSGDKIIKIDGQAIIQNNAKEIAQKLRGKNGTIVNVVVERVGKEIEYNIVRSRIRSECVNYKMLENDIGYISMSGFDDDASLEFRKAKISLMNEGADSLIIDLRDNPGGLVSMAVDIANQILGKGYIMHLKAQGEYFDSYSATDAEQLDIPIAVLINEGSASASEILAGALKDNKAAIFVGTTTYGKGVAQQVLSFKNGNSMKLSICYFETPNKSVIQEVGISPDVVVRNITGEENKELQEKYKDLVPMAERVKPVIGTVGLNVYAAQERLAMLGYYKGNLTAKMDKETMKAVNDFQKEAGLSQYQCLDFTTINKLEKATYNYAFGVSDEDLQLNKAVELLKN